MKKILNYAFPFLRVNRSGILNAIFFAVIADIFLLKIQSDYMIFGILGLYMFVIKFFKLESKTTFTFCMFILGLLFMGFVFTGSSEHTEKAAVWLFLFMATGILQELLLDKK